MRFVLSRAVIALSAARPLPVQRYCTVVKKGEGSVEASVRVNSGDYVVSKQILTLINFRLVLIFDRKMHQPRGNLR